MTEREFASLVEKARTVKMTEGDCEIQRRSFAFGNANIENEHVTRELIEELAETTRATEACAAAADTAQRGAARAARTGKK